MARRLAPSHYLNQCWNLINWTGGNKLHWNLNRNLYIFIPENTLENVVWKIAAILYQPQFVKLSMQLIVNLWLIVMMNTCTFKTHRSASNGWYFPIENLKCIFLKSILYFDSIDNKYVVRSENTLLLNRWQIIRSGNYAWFPPQPSSSLVMWGTEWPKFNMVIKGKYFLWTMTSNSLTENEEHGIPSQILKTIFGLHASFIF